MFGNRPPHQFPNPRQLQQVREDQYWSSPNLSPDVDFAGSMSDSRGKQVPLSQAQIQFALRVTSETLDSNGYYKVEIINLGISDTVTGAKARLNAPDMNLEIGSNLLGLIAGGTSASPNPADDGFILFIPISVSGRNLTLTAHDGTTTEITGPINTTDIQIFRQTGLALLEANDTEAKQGLGIAAQFIADNNPTEGEPTPTTAIEFAREVKCFEETGITVGTRGIDGPEGLMLTSGLREYVWVPVQTTNYNPAPWEAVRFDVTSNDCTVKLPASAIKNQRVIIFPYATAGSNKVVLFGTLSNGSDYLLNGALATGNYLGTGWATGEGSYEFICVKPEDSDGDAEWTCLRPLYWST